MVRERTISGTTLVVAALVVTVAVTGISLLLGPALREDVRQVTSPRTLREPVATGSYGGRTWEAVGRYDGSANCVELRLDGQVLERACDAGDRMLSTAISPDGPIVAYGVAPETQTAVTVTLDDQSEVSVPTAAGDLGFPVSFWAVELPPGRRLLSADVAP